MRARVLAVQIARWSLVLLCASGCELIAGIDDRAAASSASSSGPGGAGSGGGGGGGMAGSGLGGTGACPSGTEDCDGSPRTACDSLLTSKDHCGDCKNQCSDGGCLDGACKPLPIGDFAIWVRADEGITLVDGLVAKWKNQAASGGEIEQPTASLRPAMNTLANGAAARPAIAFDGRDDSLPLLALQGFQQLVIVLVFAANSTASSALFEFPGANGPQLQLWHPQSGNEDLLYQSGGLILTNDWYRDTTTIVTVEHGGGGQVTITMNGDRGQSWTGAGAPSLNAASWFGAVLGNNLGGRLPLDGRIGELIVSRELDPEELDSVHTYLRTKYGI